MEDGKKAGFWSKIFGGGKSGCCNLRIEEVAEVKQEEAEERETEGKSDDVRGKKSGGGNGPCSCGPGCCGG